jgi:hypothetical protein
MHRNVLRALTIATLAWSAGAASPLVAQETPRGVETRLAPAARAEAGSLPALREATARFHSLDQALAEGYTPFGGCFSDPNKGAMGFHFANEELIADPEVDPLHPELLLYESDGHGSYRLVGMEYLTFQAAWHAQGEKDPPSLFGQRFGLNTTLLSEPFYLLHVWAWKYNPAGRFEDWNPRVTCP